MTDIALEPDTGLAHRIHFAPRPNAAIAARAAGVPVLDVVVPVYNEQTSLAGSIHRLHRYLRENFPFEARITIADNASIDATPRIANELAAELTDVRVVRLEQKGRGRALHAVWSTSDAPVLAYMDVDLSTDLAALARSSPRSSPGTRTWPSEQGWAGAPEWCAARSARSSPAATT